MSSGKVIKIMQRTVCNVSSSTGALEVEEHLLKMTSKNFSNGYGLPHTKLEPGHVPAVAGALEPVHCCNKHLLQKKFCSNLSTSV